MNENIFKYIDTHKERFLQELMDLLRIPSISTQKDHSSDCVLCAEKIKSLFENLEFKTKIFETKGAPIVYAEKNISSSAPTLLIYGHYDVQPPDPLDLWNSNPFEPLIKDGNIYARGAADDKGQFLTHIKAAEILSQNNALHCNLKFIIEGEEEIGSIHLEEFIIQHKKMLQADVILISDTAMLSLQRPSIDISTRGLSYIELEAICANRDLHSGVYGGGVANPLLLLSKIIANLHDENNRITLPHFYDDVIEISQKEKEYLKEIPFNEQEQCKELGVQKLWGEKQYSYIERTGVRPTLELNGLWGGYIGEGAKTVLPAKAYAKISCRLVPYQDYKKMNTLLKEYFENLSNSQIKIKVSIFEGGAPYITPIDTKEFKIAAQAFEKVLGKTPIPTRGGGSIPITSLFEKELGIKVIFLGYGLNSDNLHSPNEKFGIENFYKGIEINMQFYKLFAEQF